MVKNVNHKELYLSLGKISQSLKDLKEDVTEIKKYNKSQNGTINRVDRCLIAVNTNLTNHLHSHSKALKIYVTLAIIISSLFGVILSRIIPW